MSRKFCGSSARPILWITRADIGKAEMPAAPIIGFIFFFEKRLISFAKSTPPTVSKNERHETECDNQESFFLNEFICLHLCCYGDAEQERDEICKNLLRCFRE